MARKNNKYSACSLRPVIKGSKSWKEVCERLGLKGLSGSQSHLKKKADMFGLDYTHFPGRSWNKGRVFGPKKPIKFYLTRKSTAKSHSLKIRLIKEGIKEHECEECGITEWNAVPAPLELDHINSVHTDNRLSNLQILCPNCHSLKTKNTRMVER